MSPFLRLLAQQGSPQLPGPISGYGGGTFDLEGNPVTPSNPSEEILVQGAAEPRASGMPVDGFSAPNQRAIEAVQADIASGQKASNRKGMFGVKGTLRDVLGLVGDAFLVQGGGKALYSPHREREKISDAWAGATEDPIAAAERVGYYDADKGQDLLEKAKNAELRQSQLDSINTSREAAAAEKEFNKYRKAREMIGGLLNTPGAVVNGVINPEAIQIAEKIAASAGMTLEEFMISEGMSEKEVRDYAMSVLDPYKQERLEDYDVGLQQGQQNADSRSTSAAASMIRAQRPPAGRAPAQPTEAAEVARIRRLVNDGQTLAPGDQATWNKHIRDNAPKRGTTPRRPSRPAPSVSNW